MALLSQKSSGFRSASQIIKRGTGLLSFALAVFAWVPPALCKTVTGSGDVTGLWQAIDDKSHKVTSLIRLSQEGDAVVGRIETLFDRGLGPDPKCVKCTGDKANKPLIGMAILWDLRPSDGGFDGGYVLDPSRGAIYRCKIKLTAEKNLEVRGYLGISAFGRTQVWQRAAEAKVETPSATKDPKPTRHDAP